MVLVVELYPYLYYGGQSFSNPQYYIIYINIILYVPGVLKAVINVFTNSPYIKVILRVIPSKPRMLQLLSELYENTISSLKLALYFLLSFGSRVHIPGTVGSTGVGSRSHP